MQDGRDAGRCRKTRRQAVTERHAEADRKAGRLCMHAGRKADIQTGRQAYVGRQA